MKKGDRILITGSSGMVGKNLVERLEFLGYDNLLIPSSKDVNLINQHDTQSYFDVNNIDYVFHLAAKVGGIHHNIDNPGEFIYENLMINCNVIEASRLTTVKKLLNLGSSCIYPAHCIQPMQEDYLLDGKPEPTNEGYALSKISALKICEMYNRQYDTNFISIILPNIYGKHDNFESEKSHVVSNLISKMHKAKENDINTVEIWGDGKARREFIYTQDAVSAIIYFMNKYDKNVISKGINTGFGEDISIKDLALLIKDVVGYNGNLYFNRTKPNGMMKKLLDSSKAKSLGWAAKTSLFAGLTKTYKWYKNEM